MSFRSFLKRLSGPLRAVPVRLMGRLVRVFRRAPKRGTASRTRPFTAADRGRLSNSGAGERKDRSAVDPALAEAEPDVRELATAPRHDENEPSEAPASREDGRSELPPNREELEQDEVPETTVAPSGLASTMSRDDDEGNDEALAGDGSKEADPLPDSPGTAAGEHGADVAGAHEATDAISQEGDEASEARAGSDAGLDCPTSADGDAGLPESNETAGEQQPTGSEPANTASPNTADRDRQTPGGNDDGSQAPVPLPHEPGSPNGEGHPTELEPEAEGTSDFAPPVDASHADARATEDDLPDTPTREPNDSAGSAAAEPAPPTASPPRVTAEGSRQEREPRRFGARRTKRGPVSSNQDRASVSRSELRIREVRGKWEIFLSFDPDAAQPSAVLQDEEPLPASDGAWRVSDYLRPLSVAVNNAIPTTISLYTGSEPLIFRQPTAGGCGTQRRRMTDRGEYVVIALDGDLVRGKDAEFRAPEPCGDRRFVAHFFDSSSGSEAEIVEGFPEWNHGVTAGSARLTGHSLFDSSGDGELFVGDAPTLDQTAGIQWARLGEEQEEGWKGQNFLVAEQTLGDVLNGACGRFFLRTYRKDETHLADSNSFRYWPDLERIELNGRTFDSEHVLIPGTEGHGKATVRLIGRVGSDLRFEPITHGASVSTDGTIAVAPDVTADELRVRLCRAPCHMDLVVALPRIWWRLTGGRSHWTSTPLSMSRREFQSIADQRLEMLVPDSIRIVKATLGGQIIGRFRTTRTDESAHKRLCAIPLGNFADHPALQDAGAREAATIRARLNGSEVCIIHVPPERPRRAPKPRSSPVPAPPRETPATPSRTEHTVLKNKVVAVDCVRGRERDKNISFTALAIVSDGNGRVGVGHGMGRDVPAATKKGIEIATTNLVSVRRQGRTIADEVVGAFGGVRVLMRPAPEGTGIVVRGSARAAVRAVIELAGIKDILIQSSGTSNRKKAVAAVVEGLRSFRSPEAVAESPEREAGESLPETRR